MSITLSRRPLAVWLGVLAIMLAAATAALATGEAYQGYGPGRVGLEILAGNEHVAVGTGAIWNSRDQLHIQLDPDPGWAIASYHIDTGTGADYLPPLAATGNPIVGQFDYMDEFPAPYTNDSAMEDECLFRRTIVFDLEVDFDFHWGAPWADQRTQGVAIFLRMVQIGEDNQVVQQSGAWAVPELLVWLDDVAEEGEVEEDEVVAVEDTGEIIAEGSGSGRGGGQVAQEEHQAGNQNWDVDEAEEVVAFEGGRWGWWFSYTKGHPKTGHFVDSHVAGLLLETPTYVGISEVDGAFDFFPGEAVEISIGSVVIGTALADKKVSPLDMFDASDLDDNRVINLARLFQSLDIDGDPQGGIVITEEVAGAFEQAMGLHGLETIDFSDGALVENIILDTIFYAGQLEPPVDTLVMQTIEDAASHLDKTMSNNMYRKNVSKTPELSSSKAKMNTATVWLPARHANDDPVEIEYYDEDVNLVRTTDMAKPIIITYTDEDPTTGAHDTWAAVSRDDGTSWKRKNLSRSADRTSFTLENGEEVFGHVKKPVFQVKGNKILVAWSSKFARGGKPGYSESEFLLDDEGVQILDDSGQPIPNPSYIGEDIWGVGGPQRSFDYTEEGFPEVGEVPFSALWVCRGVIATQNDVSQGIGEFPGDIVWYKPERMTSGRRDVNQIFCGAGSGAGFALVWQEDPEGVRPGHADGPGPGWSGATTSHKTDIWYSYISWGDHSKIDDNFVSGGDPEHDLDVTGRPKALVPMSLPVRLSNNDVINTDNIMVQLDDNGYPVLDAEGNYIPVLNEDSETEDGESDGTHRYGYMVPGLIDGWYEFYNNQDARKIVAITDEELLLDGDTGASRGNIFLQPYKYWTPNGMKTSAWVIITYEETKGSGNGPEGVTDDGHNGELYSPDEGKNVIYHSFDLKNPDLVSPGHIMNMPECETITVVDEYGNEKMIADRDQDGCIIPKYLQDEEGNQLLDFQGHPQFAYENARRGRFLLQGIGAIRSSRTIALMVFKQGQEGHGRPSDIMMHRWEVPTTDVLEGTAEQPIPDNPYRFENVVGEWVEDIPSGKSYFAKGPLNVSSVTPTVTTPSMGDPESDDPYGAVKVVEWVQTEENLLDLSMTNPYDEARAHRGQLRGDFVELGFTYTSNWAASRNGNDHYDFYIRRSFNGGKDFTTKPAGQGGQGVEHCRTWTYPSGTESAGTKVEECTEYPAGGYEAMRNLSHLKNNKETVIEPRIVSVPGTIKAGGVWTGNKEDKQDTDVFYVSFGTSTNPKKDPETGLQDEPENLDLYYSFSIDKGETYHMDTWVVNPDSDGNYAGESVTRWPWLARGDNKQAEAQLRMTPDGSRFYATWLDEGNGNSDIQFRRLMPKEFPNNVAVIPEEDLTEPEEGSDEDSQDDSGGESD